MIREIMVVILVFGFAMMLVSTSMINEDSARNICGGTASFFILDQISNYTKNKNKNREEYDAN
jgi:hypothetical protein